MVPDRRLDGGGRGLERHDDGQVALDGRETGRGRHAELGRAPAGQPRDREFGDVDALGTKVEGVDRRRVQLPQSADQVATGATHARRGPGAGSRRRSAA